jgi:UDP-2,3-diacylglucosamine pyrophosphatase LpxH
MQNDINFPRHDELYVISDLHMGGDKVEFQILRETRRLAGFIRWVASQRPDGQVALVLNGDVVDTLAEDVGGYIAMANAASAVQRIMDDPSFSGIWSALADFVKKPNRTLIICIGNHDIELALPQVQRLIFTRLAGEDKVARSQIQFSTVGAGYTCNVGTARVFCTHGNEVDSWNFVRYEDLSRLARRLNTGRTMDASEWLPNAGTRMVKDIMNQVKRRYAWIDLLKPETQAATGVLLVLDPSQATNMTRVPPIAGELIRGELQFQGRLGGEAAIAQPAPTVDRLLGANLAQGLKLGVATAQKSGDLLAQEMLLQAEANFSSPGSPAAATAAKMAAQPVSDEMLGLPRLVWDRMTGWITGVGKCEALRRALLDWLADDKTFEISTRDFTYVHIMQTVGTDIDFVVTGHTHLHRAIDAGSGRYYFNTGTWIRLLRFSPAMLKDAASFQPVFDVLEDGQLSTIDAADFGGEKFVLDRTSAVCIKAESTGVTGTLGRIGGTDSVIWNEEQTFRRV